MAPGSTEITHMKRNVSMLMAVMIVLGLGMIGSARAQDDEGPMSALRFVVVRDSDGKPVRNAQVVLHPVKRKGKQAKGEIELKTDAEGRTNIDGIPYGPLRVQVLAPHFDRAVHHESAETMILDLSDVPYIDSVGLGSLVAACVSHQKTGRCLVLTGVKPRVRKVMEITKVNDFFVTFGTTWEAVEALANTGSA